MKAPRRWTGWSRSRSAASPSRRPRRPASGATTASTSSTRPGHVDFTIEVERSLARARRRGCRVRRRERRRAAIGDGVAPGRQIRRAAHLLRQQDGPHRRRLLHVGRARSSEKLGAKPLVLQLPIGAESAFHRRRRSRAHEGGHLEGRDAGRRVRASATFPDDLQGPGGGIPRQAGRDRGRDGRRRARSLSRRQGADRGDAEGLHPQGHGRQQIRIRCICGSAFKNKGVQPLLDAVVDYLPSPIDVAAVKGTERRRQEPRWSASARTTSRSPASPSRS